ncbi:MAG: DUF5777 family beta-barrel protein [Flavobacteriaceae bacterium]
MQVKKFLFLLFCLPQLALSQDDLLNEIDKADSLDVTIAAFKGLKIVNFESTKLVNKREFYFIISHRFGSIKNGIDDFFGLDFANTRLQVIYGFTDGFNLSISRHSFNKTYEMNAKYRLGSQQQGFPVTIVGYSQVAVNTLLEEALILRPVEFSDRISFTQQLLVSRKVSDRLSVELMPTYFYEGYVDYEPQDNNQYALGIGGRYKVGKRWSINVDYGWHLNRASGSPFVNPLSLGVDIETGGHVFQLHFTNAQPTFESGFLGNATGDWGEGDIYFGFNISRVFNF